MPIKISKHSQNSDENTEGLFDKIAPEQAAGQPVETRVESELGSRPLADRMRPRSLDEFVGQQTVLGPGTVLRRLIEKDELLSLIFWGPPGTGKTTLAEIIARYSKAQFMPFSAVTSGIKEVRAVMVDAERYFRATGRRTLLF